jgi:hypothetical protein
MSSSNSSFQGSFATQILVFYEDPIFYFYVTSFYLCLPAFTSQVILVFQIYFYRLAGNLSTNLLINIGCWIFNLFIALSMCEFFCGLRFWEKNCLDLYVFPNMESPYKSSKLWLLDSPGVRLLNELKIAKKLSINYLHCIHKVWQREIFPCEKKI